MLGSLCFARMVKRNESVVNLDLETDRLRLRPLAETDLEFELELLTDPKVTRYIFENATADQVTQWMPTIVRRCAHGCIGMWCVIDKATDKMLGNALLLPLPIDEADTNWNLVTGDELPDGEIEVGYLLKPSAWGKGYATEVCKRLLRFGFEDAPLPEIVAVTHPDNTASQHVLRKAGMAEEGLRRAYAAECPGFRITRAQWRDMNMAAG